MKRSVWVVIGVGIAVSLFIAGFVSFYASSSPDGLEKVAEDQGFIETAQDSANASLPTADYGIAGVESERLSVGLAGILGVAVMAVVAFGLFWWLGKGKKPASDDAAATTDSVDA
jgi:cobalt/nickel transport system permease protein